jgi:hypothetical protein
MCFLRRDKAQHTYEDGKDAVFAGRIVSRKYKAVQVTTLMYIPCTQATYVVGSPRVDGQ